MVCVSRPYAAGYPKLVAFITDELTKIPQKPRIYNAFNKYAEYTRWWEGNFIFYSWTDPRIQIWDLNIHSKKDEYTYAEYKPEFPRDIYLDTKWAQRFERDYKVIPQAATFMEACLLHEMCHRGDHDDGIKQQQEAGYEFEKAAYGAVQEEYWTGPI